MQVDTVRPPRSMLRSVGNGVAWNLVAAVFTQGVTFAASIALARLLGKTGFGEYSAAMNTAVAGTFAAHLATGYTVTKYLAELRQTDPMRAGRLCSLAGIVASASAFLVGGALFLGAGAMSSDVFHTPLLVAHFRWAALVLFFGVLNAYQMGILLGLEAFASLGKACAWGGIAAIALPVGLVIAGYGSLYAIAGAAIGALIRSILLQSAASKELRAHEVPLAWKNAGREVAVLWRFTLPNTISSFSIGFSQWAGTALLGRQTGGLPDVGVYSICNIILMLLLFLPSLFDRVTMSILNRLYGSGEVDRFGTMYAANVWATSTTAAIAGCVLLLTRPIVALAFPTGAAVPVSTVLLILLSAATAETAAVSLSQFFQVRSLTWRYVSVVVLPRDIALIGIAATLTPEYRVLGVLYAYFLSRLYALTAACVFIHMHSPVVLHDILQFPLRAWPAVMTKFHHGSKSLS